MKRTELCPLLQRKFTLNLSCGVDKIEQPGLSNIWFVVPPPPPKTLPSKLPVRALTAAANTLDEIPPLDKADTIDKMIAYLFVRREAIQSSRIEGTFSTLDHVLTPGDLHDQGTAKSDRASVLGYAHALETEIQKAARLGVRVFTDKFICALHRKMMSKDPHFRDKGGCLRDIPVFIGGLRRHEESIYNPTPPRHIRRCLSEVIEWFRNQDLVDLGEAGMGLPLSVRLAIGHAHFEAVHPFSDGNGRVGRMLMALQMAAQKKLPIYLSGFIEAEKTFYIKALQQAQKKLNYAPIVEFICDALVAAHHEAVTTRNVLLKLPEEWKKRCGTLRKNSATLLILDQLIQNPMLTVNHVQSLIRVSKPAANQAVAQLVQKRVLRERTGNERNRIFATEEVIELLSRGFYETPQRALARAHDLLQI